MNTEFTHSLVFALGFFIGLLVRTCEIWRRLEKTEGKLAKWTRLLEIFIGT